MGIFGKGALCSGRCLTGPRGSNTRPEKEEVDQPARRPRFKFLSKWFRSESRQNVHVYHPPIVVTFEDALITEGLLVPGSNEHPVLNICSGFLNEELGHYKRMRYRSYGRSRWDDVFATPGVLRVAQEMDVNEPIVDELPVSLIEAVNGPCNQFFSVDGGKLLRSLSESRFLRLLNCYSN